MNGSRDVDDDATEQLIRALEAAPVVAVPDDFSARVMARLPRQTRRRYVLRQSLHESRVGRSLTFAVLLVLVAAMLLLAPQTVGSTQLQLLQGLLFLQLAAMLIWIGVSYKRLL